MNYKSTILKKNNCKSSIIGVIGLGYVGLPLAIEFCKKYETLGFDLDNQRIQNLNTGNLSKTLKILNLSIYFFDLDDNKIQKMEGLDMLEAL